MKWAEVFQIRTANGLSPKGLLLYDKWLRERIRSGASIDQVVKELLPASGGTFENPAVNYFQTETSPQLMAENVAQVFLGTRIQCAQCHNHPFDRWTMDDYYGFAAFFGQVGYKAAQDPRELTVYNAAAGETRHPVGDRPVKPKFLGGTVPEIKPGQDYRAALADWLARQRTTPRSPATSATSSGPTSSARGSWTRWTTSACPTPRATRNCWPPSGPRQSNTSSTSRSSPATSA